MLFNVANRQTGRSTHCGVLEFIADEGHCYLPYWVRGFCSSFAGAYAEAPMTAFSLCMQCQDPSFAGPALVAVVFLKLHSPEGISHLQIMAANTDCRLLMIVSLQWPVSALHMLPGLALQGGKLMQAVQKTAAPPPDIHSRSAWPCR